MIPYVYKILRPSEMTVFLGAGVFDGSPDDRRDGYIHLSTEAQLARTWRRHFAGETSIFFVRIITNDVSDQLRWEPSTRQEIFPHLYAPLPMSAVQMILTPPADRALRTIKTLT
ncbi:MAG: DUF952 domain-containing protein [Pseudomonadota bacterium]